MLPDEAAMPGIDTQFHCLLKMVSRLFALAVFEVCHAEVIAIDGSLWLSPHDLLQNGHSLPVIVTQVIPPGKRILEVRVIRIQCNRLANMHIGRSHIASGHQMHPSEVV